MVSQKQKNIEIDEKLERLLNIRDKTETYVAMVDVNGEIGKQQTIYWGKCESWNEISKSEQERESLNSSPWSFLKLNEANTNWFHQ